MKSETAIFTFLLMDVSILPVYLIPIWDGTRVITIADYPYMCGFYRNLSDGISNIPCGCAIISPNYALTAAHCLDDGRSPSTPFTFFAGSVNFKEGQTREILKATDVLIHPNFNYSGRHLLTNTNLAIIKLRPELNFTNIKSIRLAGLNDCIDGAARDFVITGWGNNKTFGGSYLDSLLWGEAKPENRTRCEEVYKLKRYDHEKNICSSNPSAACFGDTGGPLAYRESNGFVLCGVIGVGNVFCDLMYTIYTRVSYYKQWICENTNNEPSECYVEESKKSTEITESTSQTPTKIID